MPLFPGAFASAEESIGSIASIEDFPSLAQVEIRVGLTWVQQCAASVLTNRHVLTTASCYRGTEVPEYSSRIRAGTSDRGLGGIVASVQDTIVHPSYGLLGSEADLAVVRLDVYLTLGTLVQQVAILGQGIELPEGLIVKLAGWGTTVQGGESSNDNLYSLDLTVHNNENCMEQYIGNQIITENMVCVGLNYINGRDFDSKDLGAPLYYENTLIGMLAFGEQASDQLPLIVLATGTLSSVPVVVF
ncbi:Serine protease 39 [Operophtera brumata]|uniref:Serine protease 39 n=1 Tax=Operophtera brumata TaxID=104452 RepID=A0A0L7L5I1_OPEBR|nr:Serine protease 39 [Operophtera brumata]